MIFRQIFALYDPDSSIEFDSKNRIPTIESKLHPKNDDVQDVILIWMSRELKDTESFATSFGMQSTLLRCNSVMISNQMKKCNLTETNRQLINGFYPDWQTVLNFVIKVWFEILIPLAMQHDALCKKEIQNQNKDSKNMTSLVLQRLFTISGFMNCVMFTLKLSNL